VRAFLFEVCSLGFDPAYLSYPNPANCC